MMVGMAKGAPSERTPRADRPRTDRRRHPRAMTNFSATLASSDQQWTTKVINLSLGGALLDLGKVATEASIAVGARLAVTISSRSGTRPLTLTGTAVVWNTRVGPQPLLAVQFDQVSGDDTQALDDLMEEALTELRRRYQVGLP